MNGRLETRVKSLEARGGGTSKVKLVFRSLVSPGGNEGRLHSARSIGGSGRLVRADDETEADFLGERCFKH